MDNQTAWAVTQTQLALDLGCDPALLDSPGNEIILWRDCPGRRKYGDQTPILEVAVHNSKLVAACSEEILDPCRTLLQSVPAEWLFSPRYFRALENILQPAGYELGPLRHFYIPRFPLITVQPISPVRWYEQDDLEVFRNDDRWTDAVAFGKYSPDILGVAALDEKNEPVAIAACSRDGEQLWQIGINVLPAYRGKGYAANLTALLRDEILRRGAVPLYSTAESHINSQNVAFNAGFRPAFAYLFAQQTGN